MSSKRVSGFEGASYTDPVPLSSELFQKIGLTLLPDGYVCVGGAPLQDPIETDSLKVQTLTLARVFTWFFACIDPLRIDAWPRHQSQAAWDILNDKASLANCLKHQRRAFEEDNFNPIRMANMRQESRVIKRWMKDSNYNRLT